MEIKTQALVIKVTDVGENDRLLTLLTKDNGIIKAFASNAKRLTNKNNSATTALCYSDFTLREVKGSYRVSDAVLSHCFFKIGCDIKKIALGQYFCEIAETLSPPDADSEEMLRLILNTLHYLNSEKIVLPLLKAIFELRALSISGYMPDLTNCSFCGEINDNEMYFLAQEGVVCCKKCNNENNVGIYLDATALTAMRYIVSVNFEKLYSFKIPFEKAERLSKVTEKFLIAQTERRFKTLDFYYSFA